jgi:hypothetical protein
MQAATQFILDNFTRLKLLKAHDGATTEEVQDTAGTIYVRKILPCTGLPYQELTELRNRSCPPFITPRKTQARPTSSKNISADATWKKSGRR